MQVHQLPEDVRRSVRLLCRDVDRDEVGCVPDLDPVQHDHRGSADCRDVPCLLHLQRIAIHSLGASRHLDVLHTQNCLQGHVQWKGK